MRYSWRDAVNLASVHRSVICGVANLATLTLACWQIRREAGEQLSVVWAVNSTAMPIWSSCLKDARCVCRIAESAEQWWREYFCARLYMPLRRAEDFSLKWMNLQCSRNINNSSSFLSVCWGGLKSLVVHLFHYWLTNTYSVLSVLPW